MKGLSILATLMFILLPFHSHEFGEWNANPFPEQTHKIRTVVIDAGHGGKDPGSLGAKSKEKDIALSIALKTGEYINTYLPDVKVVYTRKTDKFLPLYERAKVANDNDADVFISIHCNSMPARSKTTNGSETYVMGLHTADENLNVAKRENDVILLEDNYQKKYEGYDPNSAEAHIILSMYQNAHLSQSILLAEKVESQFKNRIKRHSRGVKQAGFVVLRATAMPSILIETGFLSNDSDESYLRSEKGQVYMASAIYRAFREYKTDMEKNGYSKPINPNKTGTKNNVVYRVQLAASPKPVDTAKGAWTKVSGLKREYLSGVYKYVTEPYSALSSASAKQKYWRQNGFADAFVVAYNNGKRISIDEAKRISSK